jgi:hypothetical protein
LKKGSGWRKIPDRDNEGSSCLSVYRKGMIHPEDTANLAASLAAIGAIPWNWKKLSREEDLSESIEIGIFQMMLSRNCLI